MSKQSNLFKHSQPVNSHYSSQNNTPLITPYQRSVEMPKKKRKFPAMASTTILIVLGLALEMWAPTELLRPSTFLSTRGGQFEGKKVLVASKDQAKAEIFIIDETAPHKAKSEQQIEVAKADVNYAQDCRVNRQQQANSAWSECMGNGTQTSFVCDMKRNQINSIECPDIPR